MHSLNLHPKLPYYFVVLRAELDELVFFILFLEEFLDVVLDVVLLVVFLLVVFFSEFDE